MVLPMQNRWIVRGKKPADKAFFDANVRRPLEEFSRWLRFEPGETSNNLYECFRTEKEAREYATIVRVFGATSVKVLPPQPIRNIGSWLIFPEDRK